MSESEVTRLEQYLRRATAALVRTEKDLDAERAARTEPIAVVSLACRLPGADTPEEFWRLLADGRDAITGFPERWSGYDLFDPDPDAAGRSYAREGGFVSDVDQFDADFFGLSQREALGMDPQQRLVLETAWEALERAGLRPADLAGTRTGVYLGAMSSDYGHGLADLDALDGYVGTGKAGSILSGRLSYTLGLQGPAITVDTACSSSLVAVHLAAAALRSRECELALVGGVTVMSSPYLFVEFSRLRAMSPDGRCRSFSADADGAGWAEGCGIVVLKRLSDARRDGDDVLAVIRGSAVNQDGRSQGLTAPNGPAQQRVVRDALTAGGLDASDVDVIEAHGTGTSLGDPIEAGALAEVFAERGQPVWLGSAKSNIGHTQAAAGVAGLIKVILALRNESLPPTLHAERPTPHVDWDSARLALLTESQPWPRGERVRRAGVSSFGLSGTNAHVIVEEAPAAEPVEAAAAALPLPLPLLVSGRDRAAVRDQAARWADWLDAHPGSPLPDVTRTAALRTHHRVRAAIGSADVVPALRALASGTPHPDVRTGEVAEGATAVLFTGQGSQRPGMGAELCAAFPVFGEAFDEVCAALEPHMSRPLSVVLGSDAVHATEFAQPALFAFEVALFRLWESWGLRSEVLVGHSVGELAAAHVAGMLSLADAARVVAARGRLMQACPTGGAMVSVEADEDTVRGALVDGVVLAAVNGPAQCVISGDADAVVAVAEGFAAQGKRTKRLTVSHAFHSHHMDSMLDAYREVVASCTFSEPTVPVISTVTGEPIGTDPGYWVDQIRQPVHFLRAVHAAETRGVRRYLECGPAAVLSAMAAACVPAGSPSRFAAALPLTGDEQTSVAAGLAEAHTAGAAVDWSAVAGSGPLVSLPTYAFQRTRFWVEPRRGTDPAALGLSAADHPWLGAVTAVAGDGDRHLFTGTVPVAAHAWLRDHTVLGTPLVPGTGLLDLVTAAARHVGAAGVAELTLLDPLLLPDTGVLLLQVAVDAPRADGTRPVSVYSRVDDGSDTALWRRHAEGTTAPELEPDREGFADLASWPPGAIESDTEPGTEPVPLDGRYAALAATGLDYGPAFRGLAEVHRAPGRVYGRVELPAGLSAEGYGTHPALLDAALHAVAVAAPDGPVRLPFSWRAVTTGTTGATSLRVRADLRDGEIALWVTDEAGTPVLHAAGLATREAGAVPRTAEHLYTVRDTTPEHPRHTDRTLWTFDGVAALSERLEAEPAPGRLLVEAGADALTTLHALLADTRLAGTELVWRTTAARTDPEQAAVWGLVRASRAEHPDRGLRLLDAPTGADLAAALSLVDEPEVVVRDGEVCLPRLVPAGPAGPSPRFDPDGTVLVTGGTGDLGAAVAEHLVRAHGVRNLVLASRRGPAAPGADELAARLRDLGAVVDVRACDVADRAAVESLVDGLRLTGVFHLAGVVDDGLLGTQDAARVAAVAAPKLDGARHLDALTRGHDLAAFVLFSSASGVLGGAGQAGYAAANAALDALAAARRAEGLPALSLAWGMWDQEGGMTARLGEAERADLRARGMGALTAAQGLRALDVALGHEEALLVPARFDFPALRAAADESGGVPPLLRGLVRSRSARPVAVAGGLRDRLAALPADRRAAEVTALVTAEASATLGGTALAPDQVFAEAGLDSVMAMDLRRRLGDATGLTLPATLAFDHPTPAAVTALLLDRLDLGETARTEIARTETVRHGLAEGEPIAIVAMSCRLPGGVGDPEGFWDLLAAGRDAVGPFPDRWAHLDLYDPDPDAAGSSTVREGGFLADVAGFDHDFFGISPREAVAMDPQQRLVLETAWEALERAGVRPGDLAGSRTGVYLGTMGSDYGTGHGLADLDGYYGTGNATSVLSGRVSYTLGLQGPAVSVDTACSSSLVALHLAAAALRAGECDLALAGGVTVMSTPTPFVEFSRLKGLSSDGRCRSFAATADGTGWAEGVGVLVLKPLSAAERDGDRVLALIRGSAVNQDGRSQGLTAPNGPSQQRVIRDALGAAGLAPSDVDAVEAHGTGTPLGDPIEAGALAEVFGPGRTEPLALGSVKSNLGHTQAAAGVVGVMKMVLALAHETLPATLHADEPSPLVDWVDGPLALLSSARPWPRGERVRRAGVSSFGLSGTNAHVVLEEAPAAAPVVPATTPEHALPLPVSGRSDHAVRAQAARWADWLEATGTPLTDAAHTAARLRTSFPHRATVVATGTGAAVAALRALADGTPHPAVTGPDPAPDGPVAALFTGQGAQKVAMGERLRAESPVFRAAFDAAAAALDPHLSRPLAEAIADADLIDRTEFAQPALFAVEVALFRLAEALGVRFAAVAGHSVGELAAAHVAGVLGLDDAARLVAARGRLMQECRTDGAMAAIEADEAAVRAELPDGVSVAGLNGPRQTVVSGEASSVDELVGRFAERGVRTRRLTVSHAFHSAHMDAMLDAYAGIAADCTFSAPSTTVVSTVTGEPAGDELRGPAYWVRQVREPVRFLDAVRALEDAGIGRYLECGTAPVLAQMAAGCVADDSPSRFAACGEGVAEVAAAVHGLGVPVAWDVVLPQGVPAGLPTYAFQRTEHWARPAGGGDLAACGLSATGHPWLATVTPLAGGDGHVLTGRVSPADHPWLADHRVFGDVLVPGTGLLDLALGAAAAVGAGGVETLDLAQPLTLSGRGARHVQVRVGGPDDDGRRSIEVHSRPDRGGTWTRHATGTLTDTTAPVPGDDLRTWPVPGAEPVALDGLHDRLAGRGLDYGSAFRGLTAVARRGRVAYGRVVLPAAAGRPDGFGVHPALLDAALHALAAITPDTGANGTVLLPVGWSGVRLDATGATELRVRLELTGDDDEPTASLAVADGTGEPVAAGELALRRVRPEQLRAAPADAEDLYRVDFRPVADVPAAPAGSLDGVAVLGSSPLVDALGVPADPMGARTLLVDATGHANPLGATRVAVGLLQELLADEAGPAEIVWVTRGAVAAAPGDPAGDLAAAPLWGLLRAVRAEYPGRALRLVDLADGTDPAAALTTALAVAGEPELVVRGDQVLAPRLVGVDSGPALAAPETGPWRIETAERGSFDALRVVPAPREDLPEGHVRVRVRAAGVNFRDVLNALDVVHAPALGLELAGEVVETGPSVTGLAAGDRVMGLGVGTFGTEVAVDTRLLVPVPDGMAFTEAATLPLAYLTAHHALVTLAGLRPGQRLLVHAAAGGVGMAAVHLARHLGLEVYATASPAKWPVLRALGIPAERIASSRDTAFADAFLAATGGSGVDAVLNALAGEFVDASLRLLPRGGHFLEMGKTDVRDAEAVAAGHPGVVYSAFDLMAGGNDRMAAEFAALSALPAGAVVPLRHTAYDVREIPQAFRVMAQGRHIGKLVLTTPRPLDPAGTVLVTGGAGGLGRLVCGHLVREHGIRELVVASRRGPDAPGAAELVAELAAAGARVRVVACDLAKRDDVAAALDAVDPAHPLTAVVHLAAVLDDGVLANLTPERVDAVLAPKVAGAGHLHRLTRGHDLAAFVLFSSLAGTIGAPGQGSYAAANAYLDALAAHRRALGLPATSLAWGPWAPTASGMTAALGEAELARVRRQGAVPLAAQDGLRLLDQALARPHAHQVPVRLAPARGDASVPPLLRALVSARPRQARAAEPADGLVARLAGLPAAERVAELTQFVQREAGVVLGVAEPAPADKSLRELGWDSLMAVELRNRLAKGTGLSLPTSLTYDYPTARAIAAFLAERIDPVTDGRPAGDTPPDDPVAAAHWAVTRLGADALRASGVLTRLLELTRPNAPAEVVERAVEELTAEEIDEELDAVLGAG